MRIFFIPSARWCVALLLAATMLCARPAAGVILYATGEFGANTTPPGGELEGSGWQYQGAFGGFQGTPIAPQFFATAKHIGAPGSVFSYGGTNYALARQYADPASDLAIWKVDGVFPTFAPLYSKADEVGKHLVVIGRGRERGPAASVDGAPRGWEWGTWSTTQRWGENIVSGAFRNSNPSDPLIYATFDEDGLPSEAHLAEGDSGGAVYIKDGGTWKLAGINYSVDLVYRQAGDTTHYRAALFDMRGYYDRRSDGTYVQITGSAPLPTAFYATRISAKRDWINSVLDPTGDADADGIANLLEYAFRLNPDGPDAGSLPKFSLTDGVANLVYRRVTTAHDIQYAIQKSADLQNWEPANAQQERIALSENVETMKAAVPVGSAEKIFLRVVVTRP